MNRSYFNHNHKLFVIVLAIALCGAETGQAVEPIYQAGFNESNFSSSGWTAAPISGGAFAPASVSIGLIPVSPSSPDFSNGRGLVITASPGQGSFLAGPAIDVGNDPVVLRVSVLALAGGGNIAVGALNTLQGGTLADADGSVTYSIEMNSQRFVNDYQYVTLLYKPRHKAIVPLIQVAVGNTASGPVTVMFDEFKVFALNKSTVQDPGLQAVFGIASSSTPGTTPTPTPTVTPVPAETPVLSNIELIPDLFYEISPASDNQEAFGPSVAFDRNETYAVVAADSTGGYQDILLRSITGDTIGNEVTVNKTFENTAAQSPNIDIDFSGTRHVIWADNRDISKTFSVFLAQIDSFGNRLTDQDYTVNNLFDDTNTAEPKIITLNNNRLMAIWRDDRNYVSDLYARRLNWTGNRLEAVDKHDFLINVPFENTNAGQLDICFENGYGTTVAVWSDDRLILNDRKRNDIYARIFNVNTEITTDNTLPQSVKEIQLSELDTEYSNAYDPHIANSGDLFITVWRNHDPATDRNSIHAAVFDYNGNLIFREFIVDEDSPDSQNFAPDVAALPVSEYTNFYHYFLITWQDELRDQIVGQIYDADNHLLVTDIIPLADNVTGVGNTSLAVGDDYHFMAVWDALTPVLTDIYGVSGHTQTDLLNTYSSVSTPKSVYGPMATAKMLTVKKRLENSRSAEVKKSERTLSEISPSR